MIIINNIIFDLGSVILKGKPVSILNSFNIDNKTYDILKIFFDNFHNLDLGLETLNDKFNQCNFKKDIEMKYKKILLEYYKYREINMDLINLINKLKLNNYNIYILSDNNKEAYLYYKENENFKDIDGWVMSCEYSTEKKDGKLFDILLKKYSLNPVDCYFIDDNIENIKIATKLGIKSYQFDEKNNIELLYEDMKKNSIKI